ncbi:replication factor A protein 3 [Mycena sp. CBHHK59/15]|nr:replication factor A protein 3 [Mycena sp. CBHHK59/15]
MSDQYISTRVNSALLPRFLGKSVRLVCRPAKFSGSTVTVVASDGGEVTIMLTPECTQMTSDSYWEVLGSVVNATSVRIHQAIKMGPDLDMKLVDDTIKLIHDPRFFTKMFMPED